MSTLAAPRRELTDALRTDVPADHNDVPSVDLEINSQRAAPGKSPQNPALFHRMRHDKSILAVVVSSSHIFAGTQGGEILVSVDRGIGDSR
jgi:di- and tripeptidase